MKEHYDLNGPAFIQDVPEFYSYPTNMCKKHVSDDIKDYCDRVEEHDGPHYCYYYGTMSVYGLWYTDSGQL